MGLGAGGGPGRAVIRPRQRSKLASVARRRSQAAAKANSDQKAAPTVNEGQAQSGAWVSSRSRLRMATPKNGLASAVTNEGSSLGKSTNARIGQPTTPRTQTATVAESARPGRSHQVARARPRLVMAAPQPTIRAAISNAPG